jgi:hypothetical protein
VNAPSAANPLLNDPRPPSYSEQRAPRPSFSRLPPAAKKSASLFISTYNLAEKTLDDLDDLSAWLPTDPAHDLYAIGVQECMCLPELRAALHEQLGGAGEFTMFTAEVRRRQRRV